MNLTDEEKKALKFFELKKDFNDKEFQQALNLKEKNKYIDAMNGEDSITDIENNIIKYSNVLEFYLYKRKYYDTIKKWYFGITKGDNSSNYILEIDDNNRDLLDLNTISDLGLLVNNLHKLLESFGNLLCKSKNKEEVEKHFNDYVVIMEMEINDYKKGKLGIKTKLINDFKTKLNENFEKGTEEYQYMVSHFFTALLNSKNDEQCKAIYDQAIAEISLMAFSKKINLSLLLIILSF